MEHDLAASQQRINIGDLLLQVSATLQKVGWEKGLMRKNGHAHGLP
ncbi:hypothetical protein [Noviherbaspirillum pedocola]|uniref:Uncharacterized protein n=1 Tax=Noviherbaspirillum pedocola TaxID=2801341 RepID=A0A934SZE6_9BURK|nr:hypothetical protein [Noviherbaspirillum pedocola]MBK4738484.1 hypothetical protein [Noviherbaspirillum pedocola]